MRMLHLSPRKYSIFFTEGIIVPVKYGHTAKRRFEDF